MDENQSIKIDVGIVEGEVAIEGVKKIEVAKKNIIDVSSSDFEKIGNVIELACKNLVKMMEKCNKPSSYSIAFGVNAGAEGGLPFITKGSIGANFTVTLNWEK